MGQLSQARTTEDEADNLNALAGRLEAASRALQALSSRASAELPGGLSLTQLRALAATESAQACSLSMLAEDLGISVSTASRLVDRLVAAGVIDRRTSEINRREVTLRVTSSGRRLLRHHQSNRIEIFADLLRALTAREARALLLGLEAVQRYIGDEQPYPVA